MAQEAGSKGERGRGQKGSDTSSFWPLSKEIQKSAQLSPEERAASRHSPACSLSRLKRNFSVSLI